ncbi:hypothetical protein SRS16CHR_01319 [Variovorax sp. SRS16]|uniref:hypothetical protein n=1 Tax=Variovorax sp. SRS16 TaxID=282217 RepID=UPI0013172B64|nr:hypothetical protein [Variovorax sp. SRS16]VTU14951.1 hypothetical protein SRS16CHR_01319 [Variovorax sp. SRS16]
MNGSGVTVQYRVDPLPQAGQANSIVLSFDGITDPAGATVQLYSDAGLKLGTAATTHTLPAAKSRIGPSRACLRPRASAISMVHDTERHDQFDLDSRAGGQGDPNGHASTDDKRHC